MADPVARDRDVRVRRVLAERLAARGEVGAQLARARCRAAAGRRGRRRGWIAARPRVPDPRSRRSRNVSAWSSLVCATAIDVGRQLVARPARRTRSAPSARHLRSIASARAPAPRRPCARRRTARRAAPPAPRRTPRRRPPPRRAAGDSDARRRRPSGTPSCSSSRRSSSSATESAPPDSATSTRSPGAHQRVAADGRRDARGSEHHVRNLEIAEMVEMREGLHIPALRHSAIIASEEWCRCRDLNPGQRGYEPRALTN